MLTVHLFIFFLVKLAAGSSGVTSQTAKRILEALESMSSPLIVSVTLCVISG